MATQEIDTQELYAKQLANVRAGVVESGDALTTQDCLRYAHNLHDKVVLITGASGGIGRSFAVLAAKHGAKLVLGDLSVKGVNEVIADVRRAGGQGIARQCNVTSWESQRDLFEAGEREFGAIDIVVPNAGVTEKLHPGFEDDVFDKQGRLSPPNTITLDVNLRGVVFTTHLAMHYLRKRPDRKGKALVLIGSMASWFAIPSGPMYSAAKHGVLGLARSEFNTLHAHGIQTALICPWFTDTGIIEPLTRMALAGVPMSDLQDVTRALVAGATNPSVDGRSLVVDPAGVFAVPFEARTMATGSIYDAFAERALFPITAKAYITDVVKLLRLKFGRGLLLAPLLGLFLALRIRRRRQMALP